MTTPNDQALDNLLTGATTKLDSFDSGGATALLTQLEARDTPSGLCSGGAARHEPWLLVARALLERGRLHEAARVYIQLHERLEFGESTTSRVHKAVPLVLASDAYLALGYHALAQRFLMLALCEDAISEKGSVPSHFGVSVRGIWREGMSAALIDGYAKQAYDLYKADPTLYRFPEAVLQDLSTDWMTIPPSGAESSLVIVNKEYVRFLQAGLGSGTGLELERLGAYLMACVPGWRVRRRVKTHSTDFDIVCSADGQYHDFRAEIGRYFVGECKDWQEKMGFGPFAKFCRVLDSVKTKFGIIFSREGITGKQTDAHRELLKVFQHREIVIVIVTAKDIDQILAGADFLSMLRQRYEEVRLDEAQ